MVINIPVASVCKKLIHLLVFACSSTELERCLPVYCKYYANLATTVYLLQFIQSHKQFLRQRYSRYYSDIINICSPIFKNLIDVIINEEKLKLRLLKF
jgi:hypothetical protein